MRNVKDIIKQIVKSMIRFTVNVSRTTRAGRYLESQMISSAMGQVTEVTHNGMKLLFTAPNSLCSWRAETFSEKEPETLEWIESIPEGATLWDVGANVGLYSVYAARRKCRVWAFEPSIFNLELLARNIVINELTEKVCIVPLALSNKLGASQMRMTTTEWGGALSTFGQEFGWDGKAMQQVFEYQTIGLSMDEASEKLAIPLPNHIKMDVDGIEHLILHGGPKVLSHVSSILLEVNDDFAEQAQQCQSLLSAAGMVLKEKCQSGMIVGSTAGFQHSFNQIWTRP